jgi:hypothetical protein
MIQNIITENEKLKRCVGILLVCMGFTSIVGIFMTYQAIKYKLKYDRRVEIGLEYNACCVRKKCTANYWRNITGKIYYWR